MTSFDKDTDNRVNDLLLGHLNKLKTLLQQSKKSTKLDSLMGDLRSNRGAVTRDQVRETYESLRQPLHPAHWPADEVRRSLIRQEYKLSRPSPWFTRPFFDDVVYGKLHVEDRASFIFDILFTDLVSVNDPAVAGLAERKADGIPCIESTETVVSTLRDFEYSDIVLKWQEGQIQKHICETEITGKSTNGVVNRLMNMDDAELSETLENAIAKALEDLQRRKEDIARYHEDIDTAYQRIEELWAKRPTIRFKQDETPLLKKLDRYLFRSNIERFVRRFTGPEPVENPSTLPRNPPLQLVGLPKTTTNMIVREQPSQQQSTAPTHKTGTKIELRQSLLPPPPPPEPETIPPVVRNDIRFVYEEANDGVDDEPRIFESPDPGDKTGRTLTEPDVKLTAAIKEHYQKKLRIRIKTPDQELEKKRTDLINRLKTLYDPPIESSVWSLDNTYVDLRFVSVQTANEFIALFNSLDDKRFTIERVDYAARLAQFNRFKITGSHPPTATCSKFDIQKLVEILNLDTTKADVFDVVNKIASFLKKDFVCYTELDGKCIIGCTTAKDAKEFIARFNDEEELWEDVLGKDTKACHAQHPEQKPSKQNFPKQNNSVTKSPSKTGDGQKKAVKIRSKKDGSILPLEARQIIKAIATNRKDIKVITKIDNIDKVGVKESKIFIRTSNPTDAEKLKKALVANKILRADYWIELV